MRVCFYSPYIPKHFGGGEKHFFDVATLVAEKHDVFIAVPANKTIGAQKYFIQIQKEYEKFLNYSLNNIKFIISPLFDGSVIEKLAWTQKFDYIYHATDGSLFFSLAKTNNLHIQIPFTDHKKSFIDRLKLRNYNIKNTNSIFTKNIIEDNWRTKIDFVHNPKVNLKEIEPGKKKEKIILNVGRFFKQLHSKRQDVLVEIFKELVSQHHKLLRGWKLVLIGNVEDEAYYNEVKKKAKDLPIEIHTKVSRETLIEFYKKATIYWHATGYDIDENISPEKVEHFGITTIEAMAAGCFPIVLGKGGQVEILGNELTELLWQTKDQCISNTIKVINNNLDHNELTRKVLERVQKFNEKVFTEKLWKMF